MKIYGLQSLALWVKRIDTVWCICSVLIAAATIWQLSSDPKPSHLQQSSVLIILTIRMRTLLSGKATFALSEEFARFFSRLMLGTFLGGNDRISSTTHYSNSCHIVFESLLNLCAFRFCQSSINLN